MRRTLAWALLLWVLIGTPAAAADSLPSALDAALDGLPLEDWQAAYREAFPEGEDLQSLVSRLARGEAVLDGEQALRTLARRFLGALTASAWRLSRLLLPAVFCGVMEKLKGAFAASALGASLTGACFLLLAGGMAKDLGDHMLLAREAVSRMADLMQGLFPLLLTLLAAVGGKASSAFFQPAVVAACGTMTTLVGASLLIKNALGVTGLMLLLSVAAGPLLQTLAAAMLYRACAAVLEPLTDGPAARCIQDFADVLTLLFVIQLSVGAMFVLLVAQMLVVGNLTVMLR